MKNAQKHEPAGLFAAGIAHDINNMLAVIQTNISWAKRYGDIKDDVFQMLTSTEKAIRRAKGLTQQLLSSADGAPPNKKPCSVSKILEETASLFLCGSTVTCKYDIPDDLWLIEADELQIGQVFQNLILNAKEATPKTETVNIRAENIIIKDKEHVKLPAGRYVRISIEDMGTGMSEAQLSKVFGPFFTTKEKGTGLGLTTCLSIIERHQGHIEVDTRPGVGTIFIVYLPASRKPVRTDEKEEEIVEEKDNRFIDKGRILLVDDDKMIQKAAGESLTALGYDVKFAKDGREGFDCYKAAKASGQTFQAVFLDLNIPDGVGGKEAIQLIKALDPEAKVILSSGYTDDLVMRNFKDFGFHYVVEKPYGVEDLEKALYCVIAEGDV